MNEILTKKKTILRHRELWNYLAEHPFVEKCEALTYLGYQKGISSDCWCCEYALRQKFKYTRLHPDLNIDYCLFCPIQFMPPKYDKENVYIRRGLSRAALYYGSFTSPCTHKGPIEVGYYTNYIKAITGTKRAQYAKQIAELPERTIYDRHHELKWLKFAKETTHIVGTNK